MDLLSKLNSVTKRKSIEPRDLFMALPHKSFDYPRDVQSEVWAKWYENRNKNNTIIKMNTGSGKTLVGLLILQSCLNERVGPATYFTPDNYLAEQVCNEAEKLGIRTTRDKDDFSYTNHEAILVTSIYTLVNGKSSFGMKERGNYPIGSLIIDDVHACLNTINDQFTLKIPSTHDSYNEIIQVFESSWKKHDKNSYLDIKEMSIPTKRFLVPFWVWQEKYHSVREILKRYENEKIHEMLFKLPLIEDSLHVSSCVIKSNYIEIQPKGVAIHHIKSFIEANRRIFMSATLSDDSVFTTALGLDKSEMNNIITPGNADDMGDRLILFPNHINSLITEEEIRDKVYSMSENHNVVVIVPSFERANLWAYHDSVIVDKNNIYSVMSTLKTEQKNGLTIFVNRYDGIDLPGQSCRILVIDDIPPVNTEYEHYVQSIDSNNQQIMRDQIHKVEQGMGRGVRSSTDYCTIILMGNKLADILLRNNGTRFFSNATKTQYELSRSLWKLLKEEDPSPSIDKIFDLMDYSLNRHTKWISQSKEVLANIKYDNQPRIDPVTLALRKAYESAFYWESEQAAEYIDRVSREVDNLSTRGYLKQIQAEYTNIHDKVAAQKILKAARKWNKMLLLPLVGITYSKSFNTTEQSIGVVQSIKQISTEPNDFLLFINAMFDDLSFGSNPDQFESAIQKLGELLGFTSTRPEKEYNTGPDNLWAVGGGEYYIIECKNNATTETIPKKYCDQLGGSVRWFVEKYEALSFHSIIIHPAVIVSKQATPTKNMRVMNAKDLGNLVDKAKSLFTTIARPENWDNAQKINELLGMYCLTKDQFIASFTSSYKEEKR